MATAVCLIAYGVGYAERGADPARVSAEGQDKQNRTAQEGAGRNDSRGRGAAGTGDRPADGSPDDRGPRPTDSDEGSGASDSPGASDGPGSPDGSDQPTEPDQPGGVGDDDTSDQGDPGDSSDSGDPGDPTQMQPGRTLIAVGDSGDDVRDLQARLRQIDWFDHDVTGYYGDVTASAVRGFQAKREIPETGEVDRRTLNRLEAMTTEPTNAELTNSSSTNQPGALDPRCRIGRVLCIDKTSRTLRWVVDGSVLRTVDVRFGSSSTPTREGRFSVQSKSRDHVSSLYDTPMPYAMFFSGGQAVHYSADFAAVGYAGASHGCVNVRDEASVAWLFDRVHVGDAVIVYWS